MTSSDIALAALRRLEGCRLSAYQDQGGVWTIGFGHTGPDVRPGLRWTQQQADQQLAADLAAFLGGVRRMVTVHLAEHQEAALAVFAFNIGLRAFSGSTLLRLLNAGLGDQVPIELLRWNRVGGLVNTGLIRRRQAEADLWRGAPG